MKKIKMSLYLDEETKTLLDEVYTHHIKLGSKKSYSDLIETALISFYKPENYYDV